MAVDKDTMPFIKAICISIIWGYVVFFIIGYQNILSQAVEINGGGRLGGLGALLVAAIGLSPFWIPVAIFKILK